jgi:hypothetical protein
MNLTCTPPAAPNPQVPYVQQLGDLYCASACVLSWRLHDSLPSVSQDTILTSMGGTPSTGTDETAIPGGVNQWTGTHDAILDFGAGGDYSDSQGQFFSRMISSVSVGVPVIALTNSGFHAVVVDGGEYHDDTTTGYHVWDSVEYMDPAIGPRSTTPGGLSSSMGSDISPLVQVISSGAAASGAGNYAGYGDSTLGRGIARDGLCSSCREY